MKKLVLLIVYMLLTLGNEGQEEVGIIVCTLSTNDVVNGYKLDSEYKINYKGDTVESVETTEIITSESEYILDYFETTIDDTYRKTHETYGGYTYNVTNENGKVTSKVTIDYNVMNLRQFVEDQPVLKSYIKDDKLLVEGLKMIYESNGATCE